MICCRSASSSLACLLLAIAASACGAKPQAAAPRASSADSCASVQAAISSAMLRLDGALEDDRTRGGLASPLHLMRRTEEAALRTLAALSQLRVDDWRVKGAADAFAASATEIVQFAHRYQAVLEDSAVVLAPKAAEVYAAAAAVDEACGAPKAPAECTELKSALEAARPASSDPDAVDSATTGLERINVRSAALKAKVARLVEAQRAMTEAARPVILRLKQSDRSAALSASLKASTEKVVQTCGPFPAVPSVPAAEAARWTSPAAVDVRKLTVVVRVKPPGNLPGMFEAFARREERLAPFYRAVASGGFGSGVVMVQGDGAARRAYVVTNRHVVEYVDDAEIYLETGDLVGRAPVIYADSRYDLAVLALPPNAPFAAGFGLATAPARDQSAVIATGFPGIGNRPSYQTTRGYVSNERFVFDEEGRNMLYVQHTAPIDGGSSGGPLTNDAGALLGVNTFKLRGREGAAFAAPVFAVSAVASEATDIDRLRRSPDWLRAGARDACLELVGELASDKPRSMMAQRMISAWMTAQHGLESFQLFADTDEKFGHLWAESPLDTMRFAVTQRIWREAHTAGGVDWAETCTHPNAEDWGNIQSAERVRFTLRMRRGERRIGFRWERGGWRLVEMEFKNVVRAEPAPTPAKGGKKKAKAPSASR
jgi:serine protease Do